MFQFTRIEPRKPCNALGELSLRKHCGYATKTSNWYKETPKIALNRAFNSQKRQYDVKVEREMININAPAPRAVERVYLRIIALESYP